MSEEGYIQFGIPGVPYSAVNVPIAEDTEVMMARLDRALRMADYTRGQYVNRFGEQPVNAPAATAEAGPPKCRVHGSEMKPSSKGSGFFCSRKLADGTYCKEKA